MRDIKFRIWDGERMLLHDWLSSAEVRYNYLFGPKKREHQHLMQYIGLKDKNGREIYEKDIIRFLNGEMTSTESGMDCEEFDTDGVIFWDDESAQWDITHRIDVTREDVFTDIKSYEVIGNIYQNPDLIEKAR